MRSSQVLLRLVAPAMRAVDRLQRLGVRVGPGPLHRVAALHKRLRRLLWPLLIRGTPFTRVAQIDADGATLTGFVGAVPVIAPWSVTFGDGPGRAFVDRTYDFVRGRLDLKGASVATFAPAYLHVPSGLACTVDGAVIADSVKKVERHIAAAAGLDLGAVHPLAGTWATVMCRPYDNYYHWIHDCVLRLYVLQRWPERPPLTVAVPPTLRPYQRRSLEACLPAGAAVGEVADDWVRVERLVLPSFITEPLVGMVPPDALAYVRRCVVSRACGEPPSAGRRLYISRAATRHRQILNEDELTDSLQEFGFEIVQPEALSFDEQVRLFAAATIIVGSRGAALTNMIFAHHARILEITSAEPFAGAVYFGLAHSLGHRYRHLFCERRGAAYVVDPAEFRDALSGLIAA
ncbi:MAG: DUF563 domain-containing protein [Vicinamibacterales bacterium]